MYKKILFYLISIDYYTLSVLSFQYDVCNILHKIFLNLI